jgi:hypothetical protein
MEVEAGTEYTQGQFAFDYPENRWNPVEFDVGTLGGELVPDDLRGRFRPDGLWLRSTTDLFPGQDLPSEYQVSVGEILDTSPDEVSLEVCERLGGYLVEQLNHPHVAMVQDMYVGHMEPVTPELEKTIRQEVDEGISKLAHGQVYRRVGYEGIIGRNQEMLRERHGLSDGIPKPVRELSRWYKISTGTVYTVLQKYTHMLKRRTNLGDYKIYPPESFARDEMGWVMQRDIPSSIAGTRVRYKINEDALQEIEQKTGRVMWVGQLLRRDLSDTSLETRQVVKEFIHSCIEES